jgi:hypothetical protein
VIVIKASASYVHDREQVLVRELRLIAGSVEVKMGCRWRGERHREWMRLMRMRSYGHFPVSVSPNNPSRALRLRASGTKFSHLSFSYLILPQIRNFEGLVLITSQQARQLCPSNHERPGVGAIIHATSEPRSDIQLIQVLLDLELLPHWL